ncbi:hypothetical protein Tco_0864940 [Tanacetum coccineum]
MRIIKEDHVQEVTMQEELLELRLWGGHMRQRRMYTSKTERTVQDLGTTSQDKMLAFLMHRLIELEQCVQSMSVNKQDKVVNDSR